MSEELAKRDQSSTQPVLRASDADPHEVMLSWLSQPEQELAAAVRELSTEQLTRLLVGIGEIFRRQVAKFTGMQQIGSALGQTIQLDELLRLIMEKIVQLMDAERATLYLIDAKTGELWSKVTQGGVDTEIRLKPGEGLAGWVASTGVSINVRDAYNDARFNPGIDNQTGFETRSVLCQPVRNQAGNVIGVVQVLNRNTGAFNTQDENLLSAIASQTAVAIENSKLYLSLVEQNQKLERARQDLQHKVRELDLLYEIERQLNGATDLHDLIESITLKALELISARASALTLSEPGHNRMFVMVNRGDIQPNGSLPADAWEFTTRLIPPDHGIASKVIASGQAFLCDSGGCGPLADAASDEVGLPVENVICVPLFDEDKCIGALEVMNRVQPSSSTPGKTHGFSQDDRKVLTLIAAQIASTVAARRHRQEQQEAERLATIGQMLTGVVHDLKNPIAVISGNVQLMARSDDRQKRDEFATTIKGQFKHLNQMTHELLTFARGDHDISMAWVDLDAFMHEIASLLHHEFKDRGVTFDGQLQLADGLAREGYFDAGKITRAVVNLARNAAEAMPDGGTFGVLIERAGADAALVIRCRDTGSGIPDTIRDTLFDSFVTSGKPHGTGLGLAIVKKIVDEHRATISYESAPDAGTTFIIQIPQPART